MADPDRLTLTQVKGKGGKATWTEKRPLEWSLLWRILGYTRPYARKRNWVMVCVVLRGIQLPILAWAISAVINGPIAGGNSSGIIWGAAGYLALAVFTDTTMHFRLRLSVELAEDIVNDLRSQLFRHLMRQPMSYYNRTKLGRIISRVTSDINMIRMGLQSVFFSSMINLSQMIGAAALMIYFNWRLFLVVLGMAPVLYFTNQYFRKRISHASRGLQESFSRVTATIAESVRGIRVTQGFVREETNAGIFRNLVNTRSDFAMDLSRNTAVYIPFLEVNSQLCIAGLLMLGGYLALSPEVGMPVGDLITFFFLANLFFSPIANLGRRFTNALSAMAGAERLFRVLDSPPDWEDGADLPDLPPIKGRVGFEDVCFHYDSEKPVLKNVSFRTEPGQMVALVGHTGSGKTTIINLISKFWLPVAVGYSSTDMISCP